MDSVKNAFANLQKVGKSLMLRIRTAYRRYSAGRQLANFSWLPAVVSHVMAEAGGSVFCKHATDLESVSPSASITMAYPRWPQLLPMASWLKPWPWLRHWYCIYLLKKSPLNTWRILAYSEDLRCDRSVHVNRLLSVLAACKISWLLCRSLCRSFLAWLPSLLALCCPHLAPMALQ